MAMNILGISAFYHDSAAALVSDGKIIAAFGPLLVVTLWRGPVAPGYRIAALSAGFLLTVTLNWTVDSPGDWAERLLPLALALVLALLGARR